MSVQNKNKICLLGELQHKMLDKYKK